MVGDVPRRQRRGERLRADVLDATLEALRERGVDQVTIAEVAARAQVHETSLYRRWGTREGLILDALVTRSEQELPIPDTGSVRTDLAELGEHVAAFLATPLGQAFLRTAAVAVPGSDLDTLRRDYLAARLERAEVIVRRAVDRGELAANTDPALLLSALIAPLQMQALLNGAPTPDDLPRRLADLVVDGCLPAR